MMTQAILLNVTYLYFTSAIDSHQPFKDHRQLSHQSSISLYTFTKPVPHSVVREKRRVGVSAEHHSVITCLRFYHC